MFFQVTTVDGWVKYYNDQKVHMMIQKNGVLEISTLAGTTAINNAFLLASNLMNGVCSVTKFISINGTYLNSSRIISVMDCNGFTELTCELKGSAQVVQVKESALFLIDMISKSPSIKTNVHISIQDTEIILPTDNIFSFKQDGGRTLLTTDCSLGSIYLPMSPYDFYKLMSR